MKKIIALFLTVLLIITLAGCKNNKAETKNEQVKKPTVQTNPSTETPSQNVWYTEGDISITLSEIQEIVSQEYQKPKNVIVLIGDGMGLVDIELCRQYSSYTNDFGLVIQQIPNNGIAETVCITGGITDSAASATALATGQKTANGYVGLDKDGKQLKNVSEIARENGKKVGIVTDDAVCGATPSGFSVHNISRENGEEICVSLAEFMPDVLIGTGKSTFTKALTEAGKTDILNNVLMTHRFLEYKGVLDTDPECKKPFFGFIDGVSLTTASNCLANATEVALKRLENENGFFLMVESCGTDKAGHGNDIDAKIESVTNLDRTLTVILKYMKNHPDTVLVVTSDHETGGVRMPDIERPFSNSLFTSTGHTDTPVGVFGVGYGTEIFKNATVDNTDIAKFLINAVKGNIQ